MRLHLCSMFVRNRKEQKKKYLCGKKVSTWLRILMHEAMTWGTQQFSESPWATQAEPQGQSPELALAEALRQVQSLGPLSMLTLIGRNEKILRLNPAGRISEWNYAIVRAFAIIS